MTQARAIQGPRAVRGRVQGLRRKTFDGRVNSKHYENTIMVGVGDQVRTEQYLPAEPLDCPLPL